MTCPEIPHVQAYLDGEVTDAAAVEEHIANCAECGALRDDILSLRNHVRDGTTYFRAESALRGHLSRSLDQEQGRSWGSWFRGIRSFWGGAASGAVATAAAALVAFLALMPPQSDRLVDDVMTAHLRSLMPGHLIDVASSDHHTVKPWFAGRADVSPPVADFAREGYRLVGGRADYVYGTRAAVTIYRHGAHVINVFAWPADDESLPSVASRNGYHIAFWKSGNVAFCAISDTALDELLGLEHLLKAMATPDSRE